jgi:glycosyltransferase involved in cell wall biosynthesis
VDLPVSRPLRVLWLIKGLGPGGAEHLLLLGARERDRQAVSPRAGYLLAQKTALVPALEAAGVPARLLGGRRLADPRWLLAIRREVLREPTDVVHAHSPLAAVGARLALRTIPRRRRPRMVTTDHSLWSGHGRLMRWADRATWRLDDAHIAVSEAVRRSLPPALRARSEVVLHGIDVAAARAERGNREFVRKELGLPADALVVGTVANLRAIKGNADLLAAARRVVDEDPDVRFVTVGQGPQEAELRALHERLGLGDRLLMLGHRPDAIRLMGGCDVFCLASRHEGLPVALMEALALGLPVVATAVGGVPEVVEDGVEGVLVPPRRPDALADALLALARDPDRRRRMAEAAAARGERLAISATVARVEQLYAELVAA